MGTYQSLNFQVSYKGRRYSVTAIPQNHTAQQHFKITLEAHPMGALIFKANKWQSDNIIDQELIDMIGYHINNCQKVKV